MMFQGRKFYDYVRAIQLDLSIGDDTVLAVHFDADMDHEDERILIDCDGWFVKNDSGHTVTLNAEDVLKVEAALEGLAGSIFSEWRQSMAEWHAEGQYHG